MAARLFVRELRAHPWCTLPYPESVHTVHDVPGLDGERVLCPGFTRRELGRAQELYAEKISHNAVGGLLLAAAVMVPMFWLCVAGTVFAQPWPVAGWLGCGGVAAAFAGMAVRRAVMQFKQADAIDPQAERLGRAGGR